MAIVKVNAAERDKLYRSLNTYCQSFTRRGVSFTVQAHSGFIGSIDIRVNGKRGMGTKNIVVIFDNLLEEWVAISDGYEFHMLSLSEITNMIRSKIQALSTLVTKF